MRPVPRRVVSATPLKTLVTPPCPRPRPLRCCRGALAYLLRAEEQTSDQRRLRPHSLSMSAGRGRRRRRRGGVAVNHCRLCDRGGKFCACLVTSCFLLTVTRRRLHAHPRCDGPGSLTCDRIGRRRARIRSPGRTAIVTKPSPLLVLYSADAVTGTAIDGELDLCVVTLAFSHRLFQRPLL